MIHLTRLNSHALTVNSDLIKFVENAPDTMLTLTNGEKIVVRESADQVIERVIEFRRAVLAGLVIVGVDPNSALAASKRPGQKIITSTIRSRATLVDKSTFGGVLLAVGGILAGLLHRRRQDRPDHAAHGGHDRVWRHHRRRDGAVSAADRAARRSRGWACFLRQEQGSQRS